MLCKKCGFELPDDSEFCVSCGEPTHEGNVRAARSSAQAQADQQGEPAKPDDQEGAATPEDANTAQDQQNQEGKEEHPAPQQDQNGRAEQEESAPQLRPSTATAYTKRDLKWTFKQTLVGKTANVLVVDLVVSLIATVVFLIRSGNTAGHALFGLFGFFASFSVQLATSSLTEALTSLAMDFFPLIMLMVFFFLPSALIVMAYFNIKERGTAPTREAVLAHRREARFKWRLSYGFILGVFDAIGLMICANISTGVLKGIVGENFLTAAPSYDNPVTIVFFLLAIGVAEIRMRRLNRRFRPGEDKNEMIINGLMSGSLTSEVPEPYADELGVAKIVRLLDIGAARSIKGAVRLIKIVDLRTKMLKTSSFVGGWVSAIVNTCTLGMLVIMAVNLNDVTTRVAHGQGIERVERKARRVRPILEVFCFLVYFAFTWSFYF